METEQQRVGGDDDDDEQVEVSEGEQWLIKNGFMDSHPVNAKRRRAVAEELDKWRELARQLELKNEVPA